jgi:hypothetical protein
MVFSRYWRSCLAALACGASAFAQTSAQFGLPPGVLLLSRIKRNMQQTLDRLPAYACLENVDRLIRDSPNKPIHALDAVRLEVVAMGDKELFAWPDDQSTFRDDIALPGFNSSGEFFSTARAVFARQSQAIIHYRGREMFGGIRAARYDFTISSSFFRWTLNIDGRPALVDTSGTFWADAASADLLRLESWPSHIPSELGLSSLVSVIDYNRLLLSGLSFLFPFSAVVTMARANGSELQNQIQFTHCREFKSESHLVSGDAVQAAAPPPQTVEFQIPPGLSFPVTLAAPVDLTQARVGDPIQGSLDGDVKDKHEVVAPKGARLFGRVRVLEQGAGPAGAYLIAGFEFTDLEFTDSSGFRHHAPYYAFFRDCTNLPGVTQEIAKTSEEIWATGNSGWSEMGQTEKILPPVLPGVAVLFVANGRRALPKGFQFNWESARFPHKQ